MHQLARQIYRPRTAVDALAVTYSRTAFRSRDAVACPRDDGGIEQPIRRDS